MDNAVMYEVISSPLWLFISIGIAIVGGVVGLLQNRLLPVFIGAAWCFSMLDADTIILHLEKMGITHIPFIVVALLLSDALVIVLMGRIRLPSLSMLIHRRS